LDWKLDRCRNGYSALSPKQAPQKHVELTGDSLANGLFRLSSKKGMAQPPCVNPFLGPGACMTPSRVTCVIAMIFLMVSLQFLGFVPQGRTTDVFSDICFGLKFKVGPRSRPATDQEIEVLARTSVERLQQANWVIERGPTAPLGGTPNAYGTNKTE
jgi:hypothetical protein